jgi:DNA topoisomerase VI subunit B
MEYFSPEELTKQIGHDIDLWPIAITKELIDNALDACEAIPVTPLIIVTVEGDRISVADNAGNGLPESTLTRSQDYAVTVSNKAHYKSPLRGRQGNALKTVWAAPFVYNGGSETGGTGRIEVVTPFYAYEVTASLNRIAQEPRLTMTPLEREFVKNGTVVTVAWRRQAAGYFEGNIEDKEKRDFYKTALNLLKSYAVFNPHAGFTLCGNGETVEVAKPLIDGWQKWLPSEPTSPHWYDVDALSNLICAKITNDQGQQTIRDFVSEFRGLASTIRQKSIVTAADLERLRLDDLATRDRTALNTRAVERLLKAMCAKSRPVKARKLGVIGKESLTARLVEIEGVNSEGVQYFCEFAEGSEPAVIEIAFGIRQVPEVTEKAAIDEDAEYDDHTDGRNLRYGLNFSPTIKCPFTFVPYELQRLMVESTDPICMAIHAASAHIQFSDRGKAAVSGGVEG